MIQNLGFRPTFTVSYSGCSDFDRTKEFFDRLDACSFGIVSMTMLIPFEWMRRFRRRIRKSLLLRGSREDVFSRIYRRNGWSSKESRSGKGSEFSYTENLRRELPGLLKDYGVKRLLDAPCGDFNRMRHVVPDLAIDYIGGDIVKALAFRNQQRFGAGGIDFRHKDITADVLPAADLMMVRDCLIHLSYCETLRFLKNFCRSEIGLLLTTTHLPPEGTNEDIRTGDWRKIHLFSPPFCFPQDPLRCIEDFVEPNPPSALCLFEREQVVAARNAMKRNLQIKPHLYRSL